MHHYFTSQLFVSSKLYNYWKALVTFQICQIAVRIRLHPKKMSNENVQSLWMTISWFLSFGMQYIFFLLVERKKSKRMQPKRVAKTTKTKQSRRLSETSDENSNDKNDENDEGNNQDEYSDDDDDDDDDDSENTTNDDGSDNTTNDDEDHYVMKKRQHATKTKDKKFIRRTTAKGNVK